MKESKVSIKEIIRRIIFIVALVVFIGSAFKLLTIFNEYRKNSKSYKEVQEYAPEVVVDEGSGEEQFVFNQEDYDKLFAINNEFKGWIRVPNTKVNYPVVQASDNDYYLTHNFKKEVNDGGAIFLTYENKAPFEDRNTIIHGHHMKDGSMFASLEELKDETFFRANNRVYINTRDQVLEYEIFSVYAETANIDPYRDGFSSDEDYIGYLNSLKGKSMFNVDMPEFNKDDKIITLSTCTYEIEDGRLLVHGRLVNK